MFERVAWVEIEKKTLSLPIVEIYYWVRWMHRKILVNATLQWSADWRGYEFEMHPNLGNQLIPKIRMKDPAFFRIRLPRDFISQILMRKEELIDFT